MDQSTLNCIKKKEIYFKMFINVYFQLEKIRQNLTKDYSLKIQRDSDCDSDYKSVADYLYENFSSD